MTDRQFSDYLKAVYLDVHSPIVDWDKFAEELKEVFGEKK